jgi:hypothetical protein
VKDFILERVDYTIEVELPLVPKQTEISIGVGKFKLVPKNTIPAAIRSRTAELATVLNDLDDDIALSATENELGVTVQSIKSLIKRLRETGDLKDEYEVTTRTKNGVKRVYISRVKKSTA